MRPILVGPCVALLLTTAVFAVEQISGTRPVGAARPSASPSPVVPREKSIETVDQKQMTIGEMVDYFSNLKLGTAIRLTYSNGSEFAGNFEGREPGRALIYCRRGLAPVRQVPLRKVLDAYVMESSTLTIRIHRKDFSWEK